MAQVDTIILSSIPPDLPIVPQGWKCGPTITDLGALAPTPTEAAEKALERARKDGIPPAALGPEDPRCGFCGGPHVFADHAKARDEELRKRQLDPENQRLLDELHEARWGKPAPVEPVPPEPWCAMCGKTRTPSTVAAEGTSICSACDRATTQRPEEVEAGHRCVRCGAHAPVVAFGVGPMCDTCSRERLRVKRGEPISRGYFIGTQGREETT